MPKSRNQDSASFTPLRPARIPRPKNFGGFGGFGGFAGFAGFGGFGGLGVWGLSFGVILGTQNGTITLRNGQNAIVHQHILQFSILAKP